MTNFEAPKMDEVELGTQIGTITIVKQIKDQDNHCEDVTVTYPLKVGTLHTFFASHNLPEVSTGVCDDVFPIQEVTLHSHELGDIKDGEEQVVTVTYTPIDTANLQTRSVEKRNPNEEIIIKKTNMYVSIGLFIVVLLVIGYFMFTNQS